MVVQHLILHPCLSMTTKVIKSKLKDRGWCNDLCLQACIEKQTAYRLWIKNKSELLWNYYKLAQSHANSVYDNVKRDYNNYLSENLSSITQFLRWWSILKAFGANSSILA